MPTDVAVPALGESVSEATLIKWHKQDGEAVERDEPIAEMETDKANVDVPAPAAGVLKRSASEGDTVKIGDIIASIDEKGTPSAASKPGKPVETGKADATTQAAGASQPGSVAKGNGHSADVLADLSPTVRRLVSEHKLDPQNIPATGPGGRLTPDDVQTFITNKGKPASLDATSRSGSAGTDNKPKPVEHTRFTPAAGSGGGERRVPMSKIRKRIAANLVQAQQTAALLHTFNDVDLGEVMELRKRYKEAFQKKHEVGLGFMSFFARACCVALKEFERVNAKLDGDDIVYQDFVHLGIAVSTDRGLTVPVLKHADQMSFAQIEKEIKRVALGARDGKLGLDELSGGTFTITNGGVFGSKLSTPIVNPPQSAILGMHAILERPAVRDGQIVIRPIMDLALGYDHRMVDGKESVSFLVRVKQLLEDPARLMLDV